MPRSTISRDRRSNSPHGQTWGLRAMRGSAAARRCWLIAAVCLLAATANAEPRISRLPPVHQGDPSGMQMGSSQEFVPSRAHYQMPDFSRPTAPAGAAAGPAQTGWEGSSSLVTAGSDRGMHLAAAYDPAMYEPDPERLDPELWTDSCPGHGDVWTLQVMPLGLLYRSYLAGVKEPRFSSTWTNDNRLGDLWDASLGGRLGLFRYGTEDPVFPEGWQVDLEGGSQARLDPHDNSNALLSVDFRVGIPVTYAQGRWQFKTGYYHISSHLGDEFLLMNPTARRLNYTRDSIMLAVGYFCTERLRLYGETAYALSANDGAEPLEFQFGADWAPARDTGPRGAPFLAANGHLREDVDFDGNLVLQAGWAWRRYARGSLFRLGVQYYKGKSDQYEYFDTSEERFGWGLWADF